MSHEIQFEKAEFAAGDYCVSCQNPLNGSYFRLSQDTLCPGCAEKARMDHQVRQAEGGGLLRAVVFGLGAAFGGAAIYAIVAALTGYEFALIAILIGWMVGKAMMRGSRGIGGRRFQVAAVLITYLSITAGYVPGILQELAKLPDDTKSESTVQSESPDAAVSPEAAVSADTTEIPAATAFAVGLAVVWIFAALAPILNLSSGVSAILGLLIIGVGLIQAWKETQEQSFVLSGPFTFKPSEPEKKAAPA